MTDRRSFAGNDRVVRADLATQAPGLHPVTPERLCLRVPVADLCEAPGGRRERQLLHGAGFDVLEARGDWAFGTATADGYAGWIRIEALGPEVKPTHRVSARATHVYPKADIKAPERMSLSAGSLVRVTGNEGRFAVTEAGHVPSAHLVPLGAVSGDVVALAEVYLGTPYLWGGNSAFGIDCSGLVQAAFHACGLACPGDSDQQEAWFRKVGTPTGQPVRGDLVFWKGHVAIVADTNLLVHANAHAMAVAHEPLDAALARIEALDEGRPTLMVRPD